MKVFTENFISDLHDAFKLSPRVIDEVEKMSAISVRMVDDNIEQIGYKEVLSANTLDELKEKARRIQLQYKVYSELTSGECYEDKKFFHSKSCPRLYAQCTNNLDMLDKFDCMGVSFIPDCPKFGTEECWNKV